MNFNNIASLKNQHSGEVAWLFGKGPSLDQFNMNLAGELRICINESLRKVPQATYYFSHDEKPILNMHSYWPNRLIAILEPGRAKLAAESGLPAENIRTYEKIQLRSQERIPEFAENLADDQLLGMSGTVHSAIDFCRHIGAQRVKLVGFDGKGQYAPSLNLEMPVGGGCHARIREDSQRLLGDLQIPFEFLGGKESSSFGGTAFDYANLYDELRRHGYHQAEDSQSHLDPYIPWLVQRLKPKNVLDIGCSLGRSLDRFRERGVQAEGVDVSSIAVHNAKCLGRNVKQASAASLPFEDNSFDLVCSADVFEHLDPGDVNVACREALRVSRRYIFMKIAENEDTTQRWKEIAGHPLHLTTQPISWWQAFFETSGRVIFSDREVFCLEKVRAD